MFNYVIIMTFYFRMGSRKRKLDIGQLNVLSIVLPKLCFTNQHLLSLTCKTLRSVFVKDRIFNSLSCSHLWVLPLTLLLNCNLEMLQSETLNQSLLFIKGFWKIIRDCQKNIQMKKCGHSIGPSFGSEKIPLKVGDN